MPSGRAEAAATLAAHQRPGLSSGICGTAFIDSASTASAMSSQREEPTVEQVQSDMYVLLLFLTTISLPYCNIYLRFC